VRQIVGVHSLAAGGVQMPAALHVAFLPSAVVMHGVSSPGVHDIEQTWNPSVEKLWQLPDVQLCSSKHTSYSSPVHVRLVESPAQPANVSTTSIEIHFCMPRAYQAGAPRSCDARRDWHGSDLGTDADGVSPGPTQGALDPQAARAARAHSRSREQSTICFPSSR